MFHTASKINQLCTKNKDYPRMNTNLHEFVKVIRVNSCLFVANL